MKTITKSDTLQSTNLAGLKKFWQVFILEQDSQYYLQQSYWSIKKSGEESKKQFSTPKLVTPKNIGKANETAPLVQAISEFESVFEKYLDKGYTKPGEKPKVSILPMLAKTYKPSCCNLKAGVYVQPKIDGTRMLLNAGVAYSRKGKAYLPAVVEHIHSHLDKLFGDIPSNIFLDGELVLPKEYNFQQTISAIKKFDSKLSPKLQYVIYDYYDSEDPAMAYQTRANNLEIMLSTTAGPVILLKPEKVFNEDQLNQRFASYVEVGYEGLMVRLPQGQYAVNQRSSSLLKVKEFEDAEFKIVDVVEGEGSYKSAAIFVCETQGGETFRVNLKADIKRKQTIWLYRECYIGRHLTVKFFGKSSDGIPRFPIGIEVRDYE